MRTMLVANMLEDFGCVSVGGNSKIEDFEEEEDCGKIVLSEILF